MTRTAVDDDLGALLALYRQLNPGMPRLPEHRAHEIWSDILSSRDTRLFVAIVDHVMVSTCMLVTAPNLMRGGAPHAMLENVVTDRAFRRQGHGRATIAMALQDAWDRGCHHVFLVTGRGQADPGVLTFYQSCGFEPGNKTGLVARPPVRAG